MNTNQRAKWAGILVLALSMAVSLAEATDKKPDGKTDPKKPAPYALIYGTVWSKENRAVPGVTVKVQREGDKKPKWERISDRRGEFAVRVPAGEGDYRVWAELPKRKGPVAEIKVHIQADERADIGLHLTE